MCVFVVCHLFTSAHALLPKASGSIYVWKVIDSSADAPSATQPPNTPRKRGQSNDSGVDGANTVSIDPEWKGATRRHSRHELPGTVFHHEPFHVWSGHKKHVIDMRSVGGVNLPAHLV